MKTKDSSLHFRPIAKFVATLLDSFSLKHTKQHTLVIELDGGSEIIPVSDPECNDAGALLHFQQIEDQFLGEVLRPPSDESDTE